MDEPLELLIDGREVTVRGLTPDATVAQLAALAGAAAVTVDDRPAPASSTLAEAGVRRGTAVSTVAAARLPDRAALVVVWRVGPLTGLVEPLAPGVTVVGRALARPWIVRCDGDGRSVGRPAAGGDASAPPFEVRPAVAAEAVPAPPQPRGRAAWTVTLHRGPVAPPAPAAAPIDPPASPVVADAGGGSGVLLPLAVSVAGSVVVAVVMGRPEWLVLGLVGMLGTVATRWQQRRSDRRRVALDRRRADEAAAAFAVAVADAHERAWVDARARTDVHDAVALAGGASGAWWAHGAVSVSIGRSDEPWRPSLTGPVSGAAGEVVDAHDRLVDVPCTIGLGPGMVLGIVGPAPVARSVARAVLVQAAAHLGPADVRIVALPARSAAPWAWVGWLPHAAAGRAVPPTAVGDAAADRLVAAVDGAVPIGDGGRAPWVLAVVDDARLLESATSAARALVAQRRGPCAAVVLAADARRLPASCTDVLVVSADGAEGRWARRSGVVEADDVVRLVGLHGAAASAAARALAAYDDPEASWSSSLPSGVRLVDLLGDAAVDPGALVSAWSALGADPPARAPVAVAVDGMVEVDLERDGPHALVAGTTGSGKSELLRSLVVSLAVRSRPTDLAFVLVDYKGGAAFDACAALPHVVGVVTDLDEELAARALVSLDAEVRRRERLLRVAGASDLAGYRRSATAVEPLARLVVVVDEFAALAAELPSFLRSLVDVARRGRSLGVHLVLATQRPGGAVSDDIRANTDLRIALRVQDAGDALDVVGDRRAAELPRDRPGRFVARLGPTEVVVAQAAWCTGPAAGPVAAEVAARLAAPDGAVPSRPAAPDGATELERVVAAVCEAHRRSGAPRPPRPWLPPLPTADRLDDSGWPPGAVGLVDDPAGQRQPLLAVPADANVAVVGPATRGSDAALAAVGLAAAEAGVHVYAVTGAGPAVASLAPHPLVGDVVRAVEVERLVRLVRMLTAEVVRRRDGRSAGEAPPLLVIVDGLPAVRAALDEPGTQPVLDALDALLADGPSVCIRWAVSIDRAASVPARVLAAFAERWVLAHADAGDAVLGGSTPPSSAPPGRVVVHPSGLTAQLRQPSPDAVAAAASAATARPPDGAGPPPIGVLPAAVPATDLPRPVGRDGRWRLAVGLADDDLAPAHLELHEGDHLVVAGPARSGRTAALRLLAAAHAAARPGGSPALYVPGRCRGDGVPGPWRTVPAGDLAAVVGDAWPPLVLVDDADLVADPDGALARLVDGGRTTVVAAGRPDALRSLYGHWTQRVRRDRRGVLLQPTGDLDGDVLGIALPRRVPTGLPPGRGYLVRDGRADLVQLAWWPP